MTELPDDELFERHAELCGLLCNPKRLKLYHLLSEDEHTVTELAEKTGIPQATVSQHLRKMRDKKSVKRRTEGTKHYYRITDDRLIEALETTRSVLLDIMKEERTLFEESI